jgi:hypothetical protein
MENFETSGGNTVGMFGRAAVAGVHDGWRA